MSWKCSVRYWRLRPFEYHVYAHALDPKARRFHDVTFAGRTWQVWPPRSVLNPENEWTLQTETELLRQITWALGRLDHERRLREQAG